jgi:hypothetical protein
MTILALLCAALASWASAGALTVLAFQAGAPRVGLLPPIMWLAFAVACALALAWILRRTRARRARLLLVSALILLPWLPIRIPPAFLIWVGPLGVWLWGALAIAISVPTISRLAPSAVRAMAADPRRAPWLAGALAALAYLTGAWLVFPHLPAGDEPHYLVITQSLLHDRDLKVENNYRAGEYHQYYAGDLKPDYLRRGQDNAIYSIHSPGLPLIVAPAFALFGYPGVLAFLAMIGALATALTWTAVWRVMRQAAASWFGWAAVALTAPFFFQAFTMYPDGPGGALLMVIVLALASETLPANRYMFACGSALAVMPWLHTRFAILAAISGAVLARRLIVSGRGLRGLAALLAVPAASALMWFGFFFLTYGTFDPAAPYNGYTQTTIANLVRGVPGLLFDQQFGLIPNAPVYLCAVAGFGPLFRRSPRLATELILITVPYALAVAAYQMWWGGYSAPARFLAPVLLPLAIPAGIWFEAAAKTRATLLGLAALVVSLLITSTIAVVDRGGLLFNTRDTASRLLTWLSPLVDVTTGLPSLFRQTPQYAVAYALVWLLAIGVVAVTARLLARRTLVQSTVVTVLAFVIGATGMLALSIVWRANRASPITPASGSAVLRRHFDPDAKWLGIRYAPFRILDATAVVLATTRAEGTMATRSMNEPFVFLPYPPAATYQVEATVTRPDAGRVTVVLDRQFGPIWSWTLPDEPGPWRQTFTLPTPAKGLIVEADAATRRAIDHLSVTATHLVDGGGLTNTEPIRSVRYGPAVVLFLGGHAYVESGGIWVAGGGDAQFAIQPDAGMTVRLFVRNAPIENRVTLESGEWRQELALEPREERFFDIPVESGRPGVLLRVAARTGARPSEVEPGNADRRLLGVWIETR